MLLSYLKLALRSLFRYKMHSSISVLGLAIGFACFIIVFVFIAHEMSYDAFHENAERLYRVREDTIEKRTGTRHSYATIKHSMASLLKSDFPEIEDIIRVRRYRESRSVHYQDKHLLEDQVYYTDPMFFDFFSFPLKEGDAQTALEAPYSIVLTEQTASKYFGSDSPVGKTLHIGIGQHSTREYLVTGVVQDLPSNTHFKFDFVASIKEFKLRKGVNESWYHTYLRLAENASPEALEDKFPQVFGTTQIQLRRMGETTFSPIFTRHPPPFPFQVGTESQPRCPIPVSFDGHCTSHLAYCVHQLCQYFNLSVYSTGKRSGAAESTGQCAVPTNSAVLR